MHISRLAIRNFRNFGEPPFEIKLNPFTLIIGENNTGKTNLLNAIGLLFNQDIVSFKRRMLEIDDINYDTLRVFKLRIANETLAPDDVDFPVVSVEATLTNMNDEQAAVVGDWFSNQELTEAKITYMFSLRTDWANKKEWIAIQRETIRRRRKEYAVDGALMTEAQIVNGIDFPIDQYEYSIYGGNEYSTRCDPYYLRMLKMDFLEALRDAKRELSASGEYRLLYKILARKELAGYSAIKGILQSLQIEVQQNQNLLDIQDEVGQLLEKVSLEQQSDDNRIDFSFTSPETADILKRIGLLYGANPISVERNGLGRNNLLYISILLSQISGGNDVGDDTYFRVIAIEEPEAHLHPILQNHLASNIQSITHGDQGIQLLMTSHSTHISSKLSLDNTAILFKDAASNIISQHYILDGINRVTKKDTITYLRKYLDATKSTMFYSRRLVLVEGISELLLIPLFFEMYSGGRRLEKLNCSVQSVNGVAFRHFLEIIKNGYFIRCLVLTDRDIGKKTENRAADLEDEFKEFGTVIYIKTTSESTFEKDIIEANKNGPGKQILLNALCKTKPKSGKAYTIKIGAESINTDDFYEEIQDYKSEFAFNLSEQLDQNRNFALPEYITDGFRFISS